MSILNAEAFEKAWVAETQAAVDAAFERAAGGEGMSTTNLDIDYRWWLGLSPPDPVPTFCAHVPVQTGMAKSWCKHCDVDMRMVDGTYQEVT